jgi:GTP cyclohydrolase I
MRATLDAMVAKGVDFGIVSGSDLEKITEQLGEDVSREGLIETPKRYIKFMREFLEPKEFNFTTFDAEGTDEMILQTNIPFYSLCEHHTAPFFGVAHIAYIPDKKIVGLSKLARTVDLYANRFQNQERITTQIAERLQKELSPLGVAVSLKAQHLCMCMRGVKKHDTWTITSKMLGAFKEDDKARNEFLNLIK